MIERELSRLETVLNNPGMRSVAKSVYLVKEVFADCPNIVSLIDDNRCLPFMVKNSDGSYMAMIDFTMHIPDNLPEYKHDIDWSVRQGQYYGMFEEDIGRC